MALDSQEMEKGVNIIANAFNPENAVDFMKKGHTLHSAIPLINAFSG